MRTPKGRIAPRIEPLESRECLAGGMAVFTMHEYRAVVAEVRGVVGALARTHDIDRARAGLARIASEVPLGTQQLLPAWQADLAQAGGPGHGPARSRSLRAHLVKDLNRDLIAGVAAGQFDVTGRGSSAFHRTGVGAPAVSAASVLLVNQTGLNLTVTAFLNGTTRSITKPIAVSGSTLFDFATNSTNSISINIRRSDGLQPPPPASGIILNRPIGGYNGKSFTISVFANLFSVSV